MAVSFPPLTDARTSTEFKPGNTALGHRWIIKNGDEQEVGRTKLFYEGSGKTVGRLMRATGLSTSGTIHAEVLDSAGSTRFKIHSFPGKRAHVELEDGEGTAIGGLRRDGLSLELYDSDFEQVLGRIVREGQDDIAFPVQDAGGERVAVLTKQKLQTSMPSVAEMVFLPQLASNQIAFQATMHLGFAGSREYHVLIEERPAAEPLGTLIALSPILAAYAY